MEATKRMANQRDLALAYWKKGRGAIPVVGADFTGEMLVIADKKAAL